VIREISQNFVHFSLIDSFPFMATVKRRRIVVDGASVTQVESLTKPDETLDRLLRSNLRSYREAVHLCSRLDSMSVSDEFDGV
jgi:hypothetical protein